MSSENAVPNRKIDYKSELRSSSEEHYDIRKSSSSSLLRGNKEKGKITLPVTVLSVLLFIYILMYCFYRPVLVRVGYEFISASRKKLLQTEVFIYKEQWNVFVTPAAKQTQQVNGNNTIHSDNNYQININENRSTVVQKTSEAFDTTSHIPDGLVSTTTHINYSEIILTNLNDITTEREIQTTSNRTSPPNTQQTTKTSNFNTTFEIIEEQLDEQTAKEVRHIAFLKVHKAASSTVQNIFYRFGLTRNLSFILPVNSHYISQDKYLFNDILPPLPKDVHKIKIRPNLSHEKDISALNEKQIGKENNIQKEKQTSVNEDITSRLNITNGDNKNLHKGEVTDTINTKAADAKTVATNMQQLEEIHRLENEMEAEITRNEENNELPEELKTERVNNSESEKNIITSLNEAQTDETETDETEVFSYDILCNHVVFNYKAISNLMYNDTVYIAIVRDPYDLFLSAAFYYRYVLDFPYLAVLPEASFITDLIRYPELYEPKNLAESKTYNSMAYDFGIGFTTFSDVSLITEEGFNEFLSAIDNIFQFVMTVERFDESLVLLKRRLGWTFKDIIYVENNAYLSMPQKKFNVPNMTDEDKKVFMKRNKFDYGIYKLFSERLQNEINEESGIGEEVVYFRTLLEKVETFCVASTEIEIKSEPVLHVPRSKWSAQFIVTSSDCDLMMKEEIALWDLMKKRHLDMLNDKHVV